MKPLEDLRSHAAELAETSALDLLDGLFALRFEDRGPAPDDVLRTLEEIRRLSASVRERLRTVEDAAPVR